jgi:beta-glucosidase/6-phospho-beta-glucosidase/beta-galactosidase
MQEVLQHRSDGAGRRKSATDRGDTAAAQAMRPTEDRAGRAVVIVLGPNRRRLIEPGEGASLHGGVVAIQ